MIKNNKEKNQTTNSIPENWTETTLGEVVFPVSKVFNFKNIEKVHFLNTGDILEGKLLHNNLSNVSTLPGQAKKSFIKNDILFSEIRPANKRYMFVNFDSSNSVASTKLMVLRGHDDVNMSFIYKFLTSKKVIQEFQIIAESRSGTFPQITFDSIKKTPISLPPLLEQQAIAQALSSFDDKIELLREENKILEELGGLIFNEQCTISNSQLVKAENILEFEKGIEVGSNNYFEDKFLLDSPLMFYRVGNIAVNGSYSSVYCEKELLKNKIFNYNDILVSFDGTVGRVFVGGYGGFSSGIRKIYSKNKNIENSFLYFWAKSKNTQETINLYSEGTTIQHAGKSIPHLEIISEQVLIDSITQKLNPIFSKILNNLEQIKTLSRTRDELLPRLMSGVVRVSDFNNN